MGDAVAINGLNGVLNQVKYGLSGQIPDGLVFRISSIQTDDSAYRMQDDFSRVLLGALTTYGKTYHWQSGCGCLTCCFIH